MPFPIHPHTAACLRLCARQCRPQYPRPTSLAWSLQHPAHGALHRVGAGSFPKFLAFL